MLLFLIPADSADHRKEYETLLNELKEFNPEMLQKRRIVAISKSDMLDEELQEAIRGEFHDVEPIFFSAVAEKGLTELKDILWIAVNEDV